MPFAVRAVKESVVVTALTSELDSLRVLHSKLKKRGWPDHVACWFDGVLDFIEVKKPKGGVFEPLQIRTHDKLRQRGHTVYLLFTVADVTAYIELRRQHGRPIGVKV